MKKPRPTSPPRSAKPEAESSTEPQSVELPRLGRLQPTLLATPSQPSNLARLRVPENRPHRILDFDIEALCGSYDDPNWAVSKITAVAWAWEGSDHVEVRCDPVGFFDRDRRAALIAPLLEAIEEADVLQGHNIVRFDLPVLNAECMRLGLPTLGRQMVADTIKMIRTKGFKKGQDNIGVLLDVPLRKRALNWQEWDDAYSEGEPWPVVQDRVRTDVLQHRMIAAEMGRRGWLKMRKVWYP